MAVQAIVPMRDKGRWASSASNKAALKSYVEMKRKMKMRLDVKMEMKMRML